ncbi:MAG TPA: autotransporter domain-containing protein [Chthoniobacter sp.]|jgi:outer membrane autotransporter protein
MKAAKRPPILKSSIAALVTLLACSAMPAKAQTLVWTGSSSNLWEDNGNWIPNLTPNTANNPVLIFTGSKNTTSDNNNFGGTLVQSIVFDQGAAAFRLVDQPVFLFGGSSIVNESRFLQTLSFTDGGLGGIGIFDFNGATSSINAATAPILINSNIAFDSPSTLVFSGPYNVTVTGSIYNTGAPTFTTITEVNGPGMVTLTGVSTDPGMMVVNGGTLNVTGTTGNQVTMINYGGNLTGTGRIGGDVYNAGNVVPGNGAAGTPGTLAVRGNYIQTNNGVLTILVDGSRKGDYGSLAVGGQADLSGKLRILNVGNSPRLRVGQEMAIITTSGGVSGRFDTSKLPVAEKVIYKSKEVDLELSPFSTVAGLTANEQAVGRGVDSASLHGRASNIVNLLANDNLPNLRSDLDRLSPEELTSIYTVGVALANVQAMNLQRRMDDIRFGSHGFTASGFATAGDGPLYSGNAGSAGPSGNDGKDSKEMKEVVPSEDRWGVFVTGIGDWVNVNGNDNAGGYQTTSGGVTVGGDYKLTSNFAVGLDAGYVGTATDLSNHGRVWVNGGKLGLYSTYFTGGFYIDTAATGGLNSYSTRRSALAGDARGDTDGGEVNILFATGYDWKIGNMTIGPTGSFQYTYVGLDSYNEHGSMAPLSFPGQNQDSLRTAFGMRATCDWKLGGVVIKPELRAAWQHEYGDNTYAIDSSFDGGADSFQVTGPRIGRDSLLLGAGFAILWNERTSTYLYYDGELARTRYEENTVSGGVRVSF